MVWPFRRKNEELEQLKEIVKTQAETIEKLNEAIEKQNEDKSNLLNLVKETRRDLLGEITIGDEFTPQPQTDSPEENTRNSPITPILREFEEMYPTAITIKEKRLLLGHDIPMYHALAAAYARKGYTPDEAREKAIQYVNLAVGSSYKDILDRLLGTPLRNTGIDRL
jgi:hypothetical protein